MPLKSISYFAVQQDPTTNVIYKLSLIYAAKRAEQLKRSSPNTNLTCVTAFGLIHSQDTVLVPPLVVGVVQRHRLEGLAGVLTGPVVGGDRYRRASSSVKAMR